MNPEVVDRIFAHYDGEFRPGFFIGFLSKTGEAVYWCPELGCVFSKDQPSHFLPKQGIMTYEAFSGFLEGDSTTYADPTSPTGISWSSKQPY